MSSGNGITFRWGSSDHLEEVLGDSEMLLLLVVLSDNCVDHGLEDILLWYHTFHVLDKVVSVSDLVILEVVDDKVQSGLRDDINQGWQNLKSILSTSEHN